MKHYFLTAKHVGDLTAILCAGLEDMQAKPAPVLSRVMAQWRSPRKPKKLGDAGDFVVDNNRINIARADVFKRDPVNLIRLFNWRRRTIWCCIPKPCGPRRARSN